MSKKVLITYASKYGSTAEIAQKVTKVLKEKDLDTEYLSVNRVQNVSKYDAVIMGYATYMGKWMKEANNFIRTNKDELKNKSVWIFSSGPTDEGDPEELVQDWRFPESLKPIILEIDPKDITVFHGKLDKEKLNFLQKGIINMVGASYGDFRDWDLIEDWANGVARSLTDNE
jgi:menaquinone-dependent protoporphyrinogen oxidase